MSELLDRISRLEIKGFPPFADCVIEFPGGRTRVEGGWEGKADVHLLTGHNGTGKTRILAALMASLGNDVPLQDRVREGWKTTIRVKARGWMHHNGPFSQILSQLTTPQNLRIPSRTEIDYIWNDSAAPRRAISFDEKGLRGLAGTGLALLSDADVSPGGEVKSLIVTDYLSFSATAGGESLMQRLLNLRMYVALERDANKPGRNEKILSAMEAAVREITGVNDFQFIPMPSGRQIRLMARWYGDDLFFSELPDGVRSLLNWLAGWVVSLNELFVDCEDPLNATFVGLLDEPENHLHPEWQRRVIPALQKLFKGGQLFIATHSPFVISSLNDGWIHKFSRGSDGKVKVARAIPASKGDSWVSAVREVLDVKAWFDVETEALLGVFNRTLTRAYRGDEQAEKEMRIQGASLMERSVEVANRVGGDMAQFDAAKAAVRAEPAEGPEREAPPIKVVNPTGKKKTGPAGGKGTARKEAVKA